MTDPGSPRDVIVHVADLHFWRLVWNPLRLMNKRFLGNLTVLLRRRREFMMRHAEPFAEAIANTGVKAVVLTGDFASTSTDEEFALGVQFVRGLRARGVVPYIMPGNHDVYTFEAARAKRFEHHFANFLPKGGFPVMFKLPKGTPLVLVPTICPRHLSSRGLVTPEAIRAVGRLLETCNSPLIVAGHYPLIHKTADYSSNRFRRLVNTEPLRQLLGESGKRILYVAGHVHRSSYTRDPQFPTLEHLTTDGLFRRNRAAGIDGVFTEIDVRPDAFDIIRHVHTDDWKTIPITD
jgi:3',5'-cyclic AMP phosphodiesterase CpdA